jgi:hypothetical protein
MSLQQSGGFAVPEPRPAVCTCPACQSPFIPSHRREADLPEIVCASIDFDAVEQVHAWGFAC